MKASILDDLEPIYPGRDYKLALTEDLLSLGLRLKKLGAKITDPQKKKEFIDECNKDLANLRDFYQKRKKELSKSNLPGDDEPIKSFRQEDIEADEIMKHLT